jgi:hypothetical protein
LLEPARVARLPALSSLRTWLLSLVAVLGGNAIYFVLLLPELPPAWVHQPFQADRGLALDFACCLALYLILRAASARWWPVPGR